MSGFGAPFGSPAPAFGFGQQQQQQQPPFGNNTGFGSPAPAAPGFGSPAPAAGFGGPPNTPFGGGGGGAVGFGQGGSTSFAAPTSFGSTQAPPLQVSPSFGGPAAPSGFGAPAFGQQPQQQQQQQQQSVGFGQPQQQSPANNTTNTGFGNPFGGSQQPPIQQQQQQQQQTSNVPNPFGGPPSGAPAPAVSFGRSSNVVTAAPTSSGFGSIAGSSGFGGDNSTGFGSTGSGFGTASASSGFGAASSSSGFGSASSNSGFGSAPSNSGFGAPPSSNAGFGSFPASSGGAPSSSGGGDGFSSNPFGGDNSNNRDEAMGGSNSPLPAGFGSGFGGGFPPMDNSSGGGGHDHGSLSPVPEDSMGNDDHGGDDDQLAKLKAKIEAKKKKLMDRQKRKEEETQQQQQQQQQQQSKSNRQSRSQSGSPVPSGSDSTTVITSNKDKQSRAEKNAIRFATTNTNSATTAFLPSNLQGKVDGSLATTTSSGVAAGNREDLASAKSLEGTCLHMCPDEELQRRSTENDIQLLEIPDPGGIHPPNWTLRNTAVKRFRRSAADYKLDVPEWVRPPDVLEEVCSYLEEWVMEKDRQGPDSRFPNNGTPVSLDVYQFIWDRTRMIRKDFILQNYVGTGGKCDARAVRCHERIARWHAMCEHQLSHISDFVVHQSQQNIQELGQAMKTLNQYYDDSLGRATVEVPDEEGRETRTDTSKYAHGCKSDVVRGGNPVDYDGTPLNNAADDTSLASNRLVGANRTENPSRGTAEPEMRALYILLTMNNDGGMEVMNYSAKLYRERPEIYNSKPVQLALEIFKAKKDYNYIRFFAILRDANTPYVFACVMFKHVELMRKIAFRIMSKTYGAKRKENGEPIYDAYPLKKLAQNLCFEDMDEARAACKHYNITVKEMRVKSSSSPGQSGVAEIVFWRHSDFKEAKDPEKGTILPCRPKKMMRSIESKLKGATRLGVCRGEVSGEGASLSSPPQRRSPAVAAPLSQAASSNQGGGMDDQEERTQQLIKRQQELFRQEQSNNSDPVEEARLQEQKEQERKNAEKKRLEMIEAQKEEKRKMEEEQKRQKEQERLEAERRMREEAKRKQEQEERERREQAEKAAAEERRRQEEERQRRLQEEARKKAAAEERERQRLEAIRKEEERKQALIRAEEERRRKEEAERLRQEQERKRLEALRREEEERRRREAEALKRAQEVQRRVNLARKVVMLRRWRDKLPRKLHAQRSTAESLSRIDSTFSHSTPFFKDNPIERGLVEALSPLKAKSEPAPMDTRRAVNRILTKSLRPIDVSSMVLDALWDDEELFLHVKSGGLGSIGTESRNRTTFLFKVAVILPQPEGLPEQSMYELIHTWLSKRLEYGKVQALQRQCYDGKHCYEVKVLFAKFDSWGGPVDCDAAIVAIPPSFCNGDWHNTRKSEAIAAAFASIDTETPRVAFVFGEESDPEYYQEANGFLASCLPGCSEFPVIYPPMVTDNALEGSLQSVLKSLINVSLQEFPPVIEQVSVVKLASACIDDTLWKNTGIGSLEVSRAALLALAKEFDEIWPSIDSAWSGWPAEDFAGEGGLVIDYFGKDLHLPSVWTSSVFRDSAKAKIMELCDILRYSVPNAASKLVSGAPPSVQDECEMMLQARQYRKCVQHALQFWFDTHDEVFYAPKGTADSIANTAIQSVLGTSIDDIWNIHSTGEEDSDKENTENEDPGEVSNSLNTPEKTEPSVSRENNTSFQKPQDIFEISRTVSPAAPDIMSPPTPTPGNVSPPAGVLSNKRSLAGIIGADDPDMFSPPGSAAKRLRKATASPPPSRMVMESSAFTKQLQALLSGASTVDMDVGGTTLARLLRDVPPIEDPSENL